MRRRPFVLNAQVAATRRVATVKGRRKKRVHSIDDGEERVCAKVDVSLGTRGRHTRERKRPNLSTVDLFWRNRRSPYIH